MSTSRRDGNPPSDSSSTSRSDPETGIRLQKVLASAGVGSRRACEELIATGRVSVDGRTVRELGTRVDPERQVVAVDGARVSVASTDVYLALNKPRGMVSTMSDPEGRPSLGDVVAGRRERLFHVGRLDADSEGLILLTNDGELAHRLTHPSYGVPKTYLVEASGAVGRPQVRELLAGVELEDGVARADSARIVSNVPGRTMVEVVLHEGRKHIVRRMFDAVGHPVVRLVRTRLGPIVLGDLRPGRTRHLTQGEVGALYRVVDL